MDFGLDDFLKQLNEKTTQNPIQSQSQAAKRKQRALFNQYLSQSQPNSNSQDSNIRTKENVQSNKQSQPNPPLPSNKDLPLIVPVFEAPPKLIGISKKDVPKEKLKVLNVFTC